MESKKIYTPDDIKELLKNNDKAVERGVVVIYKFQTEDEKRTKETTDSNGVGFNGADAFILSSFAKQLIGGRNLSQKQMDIARNKIIKYAGQLAKVANNKN